MMSVSPLTMYLYIFISMYIKLTLHTVHCIPSTTHTGCFILSVSSRVSQLTCHVGYKHQGKEWHRVHVLDPEQASSESESGVFSMSSSFSDDEDMAWSRSWPSTAWHCFLKGKLFRVWEHTRGTHKGNTHAHTLHSNVTAVVFDVDDSRLTLTLFIIGLL
jgi:hypothetical protein